jgi:hypothetical protein
MPLKTNLPLFTKTLLIFVEQAIPQQIKVCLLHVDVKNYCHYPKATTTEVTNVYSNQHYQHM